MKSTVISKPDAAIEVRALEWPPGTIEAIARSLRLGKAAAYGESDSSDVSTENQPKDCSGEDRRGRSPDGRETEVAVGILSRHPQRETGEPSSAGIPDEVRADADIGRAIRLQARQGYTEIVVRNPKTNGERKVVLPKFERCG